MKGLKEIAQFGVVDYVSLMSLLKDYKAPHRKITGLLKHGDLIRVKKGLYVLGEQYRSGAISRYLLANLIYGPSYLSQEYALQFYGLIPERVHTVTSMVTKRNKCFDTPLGVFQYTYLNQKQFSVGVDRLLLQGDIPVLMASPEKAVCDSIKQCRDLKTMKALRQYLFENMRLEKADLQELDGARLEKIVSLYHNPVITRFYKVYLKGF